jgi:hypothetical protein
MADRMLHEIRVLIHHLTSAGRLHPAPPCKGFLPVKNTPFWHPATGGNFLDLDWKTLYELDFTEKGVRPTADAIARWRQPSSYHTASADPSIGISRQEILHEECAQGNHTGGSNGRS